MSTAASAITAGCHMRVVDTQGWGLSEEFVPKEEKIELLKAVSLCGLRGPHVVLLVIPLLDFTESEGRAVERRMGILTSAVWRHTMVLFTYGDWLRRRGCSVKEHIQSGGPALHRLMEKCRYRYHVLDNKAAVMQEVQRGGRKQEGTWQDKIVQGVGRKSTGGETDGRKEGALEQVRELLSKVEDMLEENGGWHFSLHMYLRMEEEWSRREQELRTRLAAETDVGSVTRKRKTPETKMEPGQRLETEEEVKEFSQRKEQENKEKCVERKMNRWEDKEEKAKVELKRLISEMEGSDSREEREKSSEVKTGTIAPCRPNGVKG